MAVEMEMKQLVNKYFRPGKLPHIWCPGCGNGIVTSSLIRAIEKLGLDQDETVIVSGIGCSSRASGYLDFNTVHSAHGRAIPVATGIKMSEPRLKVIVITGDGDATAIGGNHLIHAARRNIDITVILYNNSIYGMTGGQFSPMTPTGSKATTAPMGTVDRTFDIAELAKGAGATFVARGTTYHATALTKLIAQAIEHKGFSIVEAITACPISFGRQNKKGTPGDMIQWQRDAGVALSKFEKLSLEDREGKFPIGVLHQSMAPEYTEEYAKLQNKGVK